MQIDDDDVVGLLANGNNVDCYDVADAFNYNANLKQVVQSYIHVCK